MLHSRPFNSQINLLHEKALFIYLFIYLFNEFANRFVSVFLEFSWEIEINWLFVITNNYVKVNFKERNNNDLLKALRFPYQKRIHNKGNLIKANEFLKGFVQVFSTGSM